MCTRGQPEEPFTRKPWRRADEWGLGDDNARPFSLLSERIVENGRPEHGGRISTARFRWNRSGNAFGFLEIVADRGTQGAQQQDPAPAPDVGIDVLLDPGLDLVQCSRSRRGSSQHDKQLGAIGQIKRERPHAVLPSMDRFGAISQAERLGQ